MPTEKVMFEERSEAAKGVIIVGIWQKSIPGKENSQNKVKRWVPVVF